MGKINPNWTQHWNWYNPEFLAALCDWADETNVVWQMTGIGGARTREQQKKAYEDYLRGGVLAAPPWGNGPHIMVEGRGAVAIDLSPRPGENRAARDLLGKYGLGLTVTGEPWHVGRPNGNAITAPQNRTAPGRGGIGLAYGFNSEGIRAVQRLVGVSSDGQWRRDTSRALQRWAGVADTGILSRSCVVAIQNKLGVTADGLWGSGTTAAMLMAAQSSPTHQPQPEVPTVPPLVNTTPLPPKPAPPKLTNPPITGVWDSATTRRLQTILKNVYNAWGLGAPLVIDGAKGKNTYRALQRVLNQEAKAGLRENGAWNRDTIIALQKRLGVTADGAFGPVSVRALQTRLNTGRL